jgi:hypothetical protein
VERVEVIVEGGGRLSFDSDDVVAKWSW